MDDFEIEVSDLRPAPPSSAAPDGDDPSTPGSQRRPPLMMQSRRRLIGGVAAAAAVGLALALVAALGRVAGSGLPASTATPAVSQLVIVVNTVPWGKLAIDGRSVPGGFVYLRPGRHSASYLAPPFAPMRCEVSLPYAATDTCRVLPATAPGETGAAFLLDMRATPDRLPLAQQHALAAETQTLFDGFASATTLTPGDHYAAPDGTAAVARETLTASLTFTLNLDPQRPDAFDTPTGGCAELCVPPPGPLTAQAPTTWQVLAHVLVRWTYTPVTGGATFTGGASPANAQDVDVAADVTWEGGAWQVRPTQQAPDIVCELAGYQLDGVGMPFFSGGASTDQAVINPADGCVLTLKGSGGPASELRMFYHCGVLLAADATTQGFMSLPAASPAEQALAARIAGAA